MEAQSHFFGQLSMELQNKKFDFTKIACGIVSGGDLTREKNCVNKKTDFYEVVGVCQKMQQDAFSK